MPNWRPGLDASLALKTSPSLVPPSLPPSSMCILGSDVRATARHKHQPLGIQLHVPGFVGPSRWGW